MHDAHLTETVNCSCIVYKFIQVYSSLFPQDVLDIYNLYWNAIHKSAGVA